MCLNWRQCYRICHSSSPSCKTDSILKVDMKGKHKSIILQNHMKQDGACLMSPTAHAQSHVRGNNNRQRLRWKRDPQATTTTIKLRRAHLYSINFTLYLQSGSLWHSLSDMFFLENKFVQKRIPISKDHYEFCLSEIELQLKQACLL